MKIKEILSNQFDFSPTLEIAHFTLDYIGLSFKEDIYEEAYEATIMTMLPDIIGYSSLNINSPHILSIFFQTPEDCSQQIELLKKSIPHLLLSLPSLISKTDNTPLIYLEEYSLLYFYKNYSLEKQLITTLRKRLNHFSPNSYPITKNSKVLSKLNTDQKNAALQSLKTSIYFIYGGPGTGKTTLISAIIELFYELFPQKSIHICAPTAKAKNRILESLKSQIQQTSLLKQIEKNSSTIERLLGIPHSFKLPKKNTKNPVSSDLLIIDELSMVDMQTMNYLLEAISLKTHFIAIGDPHQLPPVNGLSFLDPTLKSLLSSFPHHISELKTQYRQHHQLSLITQYILKQNFDSFLKAIKVQSILNPTEKIFSQIQLFINQNNMRSWVEDFSFHIENLEEITIKLNKKKSLFQDFIFLSPYKEGKYGSNQINTYFKKNLHSKEIYPSLPVMISKNNYDLNLFNGDRGVVILIKKDLYFAFYSSSLEKYRLFPYSSISDWEVSYATTIHKSQGSEFNCVFISIDQNTPLNDIKLLYTAFSRAKKIVHLFSHPNTLKLMFQKKNYPSSLISKNL